MADLNKIALISALQPHLREVAELCGFQLAPVDTPPCNDSTRNLPAADGDPAAKRLLTAKAWLRASAIRTRTLGTGWATDPAWDMLLDLYVSTRQGRLSTVKTLEIAGGVPSTTAIRWIDLLVTKGWLTRGAHMLDRRVTLLRLTLEATVKIEAALDEAVDSDRRLGLERMVVRQ